jgi:hypothetical protein
MVVLWLRMPFVLVNGPYLFEKDKYSAVWVKRFVSVESGERIVLCRSSNSLLIFGIIALLIHYRGKSI